MYNFIGHDSWRNKFPQFDHNNEIFEQENTRKVTVLRATLFFCSSQVTTLGRIRAHFTDLAIAKLVHDKFIEIDDKKDNTPS